MPFSTADPPRALSFRSKPHNGDVQLLLRICSLLLRRHRRLALAFLFQFDLGDVAQPFDYPGVHAALGKWPRAGGRAHILATSSDNASSTRLTA